MNSKNHHPDKVAIVTGAARRLGAFVARDLHSAGYSVLVHYRNSESEARQVATELNTLRANSATTACAELTSAEGASILADQAVKQWGRIDLLINNASEFFPTPFGSITSSQIDKLFGSNFRGPLFLSQACAPALKLQHGNIINMTDIYASMPHPEHSVYCAAKASLVMLTRSLAKELAPDVRVNAIAPGAILWPEKSTDHATTIESEQAQAKLIESVPLKRKGTPADIAHAVAFLSSSKASYITGETLVVDGGRSL